MLTRLFVTTLAALSVTAPIGHAAADSPTEAEPQGVIADYYGTTLDLSQGWGTAQACGITPDGAACFDTERELDDYLDEHTDVAARATPCSSSVRLYDGTNYGLPVLAITTRLSWRNLSSSGFDNLTSSYKVGACAAAFAGGANGSSTYPGSTGAGAQATSMMSGWDNTISSIYLY